MPAIPPGMAGNFRGPPGSDLPAWRGMGGIALMGESMSTLTALIDARLAHMPQQLALEWPGGRAGGSSGSVRLKLRNRRLLTHLASGRIGHLADAYVKGDVDIEGSLGDVMAVAAALVGDPVQRGIQWRLPQWLDRWRSRWFHSIDQRASQVQFHYDVSDAFYGLWLDPLRVYSCAYYAQPGMTLAQAQVAKLDLVCSKLQLQAGQRFLDIGAGWGGLMLRAAAHHGVQAVGITLSRNQHEHIERQIDAQGLRGRAEVHLLDFRQLAGAGGFDRIASVGMFEHVGRAQMPRYFDHLKLLLRPGGLLLNHGITAGGLDNLELGAGMGRFIEKHIFPGGELVHVTRAAESLARSGLELLDAENLRPHYARTLWDWSANLEDQLDLARHLTSDAKVRAYRLYLAGSALCFERGWLSLYQLLAARPETCPRPSRLWAARSDYAFNRRHMLA